MLAAAVLAGCNGVNEKETNGTEQQGGSGSGSENGSGSSFEDALVRLIVNDPLAFSDGSAILKAPPVSRCQPERNSS